MMRTLKLRSTDGKDFEVEREVALKMGLVKEMLADGDIEVYAGVSIVFPNVEADVLEYVILYCVEHIRGNHSEQDMKEWDTDFVDVDDDALYELIMAANYLNIKELLELICEFVADMIRGKTAEEIRENFGIENDFTEKEEEEIRKENEWHIDE